MDLEIALEFVNQVLITKAGRDLRPPEITVFCGTWQGITYEQMAESSPYSANYLMRDIAPKFWKLLSTIFDKNIGKSNLKIRLCKLYDSSQVQLVGRKESEAKDLDRNWQRSVVLPSVFYGRREELKTLRQWATKDRCQLIKLWGLSGTGKTLLMKKLGEQIQEQYEVVIWRSLSVAFKVNELIADLLNSMGIVEKNTARLLPLLLEQMRTRSCLIMLDGVEAIFQSKAFSGKYISGYENYHEFFQAIGQSSHQSCVIVTSLENFGRTILANNNIVIRSLKLSGLPRSEARSLFTSARSEIVDTPDRLIDYYQGNPGILNVAAQIINRLFNGNVEEFLEQKSLVFGEINRLLNKSFDRLSSLETEILYWLASESQPMSLSEIQNGIPLSIYPVELIEALESLTQRSLIETTQIEQRSVFILSPMMREFVIDRFVAQIGNKFSVADRQNSLLLDTIELGSVTQTTHLSQWLQNRFELGWQPVETLFTASRRSPARLRSAFNLRGEGVVKRFKKINLDDHNDGILLLIAVSQEESAFQICVQAQPTLLEQTLPPNLCLNLLDSSDAVLATIVSEAEDNFIQLPYFRGAKNEKFKIGVALNSGIYQEDFLI